ncbi:MAG: hypothetical protein JXA06_02095 [Bacteroidetes bacterium]|nr:hypothetical protein [Bacteroidota bacterium]
MKNNFLHFILLLVILIMGCKKDENITSPTPTQGEWKIVRNADTTNNFWGLCFADQMNGWAIGNSGIILRTSDGGNSWNNQESGTTSSLKCVYFANAQKGWIGGGNNSIGMTTNGGATWSWQQPDGESRRTFMSMSFPNENTGWIVDNYGGILHTKDGGMTWIAQISGTTWAITSVQFLDTQEGWAVATNRVVLHTTDGGNNWTTKILDTLNYGSTVIFDDIFFYNRSRGWIATISLAGTIKSLAPIVYTSDTGKTWICRPSQVEWIESLQFVTENLGWAVCSNGILHTIDGGITWNNQFEVSSGLLVDLYFVNQSRGWVITYTGDIYRYQTL